MKKKSFDTPLLIAIVIPVIIIGIVVGSVARMAYHQRRFWSYVEELSASTVYAYEHDGLSVTKGAETVSVTGEDVYRPYRVLITGGPGNPRRAVPKGEADLDIAFGDGSRLRLWRAPVKNAKAADGYGVFVCYENTGGKRYCYDTDKFWISSFDT